MLPNDVTANLEWGRGDVLSAEVVEGGLKIRRVQTFHDRAMEIARQAMVKCRENV